MQVAIDVKKLSVRFFGQNSWPGCLSAFNDCISLQQIAGMNFTSLKL